MSVDTTNISFGNGLLVAALGVSVVFSVLVLLMAIIKIQTIVVESIQQKDKSAAPAGPAALSTPDIPAPAKLAKGSCGGIALHDVPDATAAMVMAIVADELQTPLNELRFISIREVK